MAATLACRGPRPRVVSFRARVGVRSTRGNPLSSCAAHTNNRSKEVCSQATPLPNDCRGHPSERRIFVRSSRILQTYRAQYSGDHSSTPNIDQREPNVGGTEDVFHRNSAVGLVPVIRIAPAGVVFVPDSWSAINGIVQTACYPFLIYP